MKIIILHQPTGGAWQKKRLSWSFIACPPPTFASIHLHENSLLSNSVPEMQKESSKWSLSPPFEIVSQWGCAYFSGTVFPSGYLTTDAELMSLCFALWGHCMSTIPNQCWSGIRMEFRERSNREDTNLTSTPAFTKTGSFSLFITKLSVFS